MSNRSYAVLLLALTGLVPAAIAVGCGTTYDDFVLPLLDPKLAGDAGGTGGADGGTGGSGGSGGTGGSIPAGCIPSENVGAVGDTCGVFVSSSLGDDGNAGTPDKPLKSLSTAIALAQSKGKPLYACGETFDTEAVSITSDVTLYGALDCANNKTPWTYDASKKTSLAPTADAIALVISKPTTSVEVFDFAIGSANAEQAGGSSIAVLVAQASASFTRCDVSAGDGKDGAAGEPFGSPATAGVNGIKGGDACTQNIVVGADSVPSTCDASSISGIGGTGSTNSGGAGSPGEPQGAANGGSGEGSMICTAGTGGDDGALGDPGLGAESLGTIAATGYTGVSGSAGTPGHVAQGGGGGGGAKGGTGANKCAAGATGGASGGSGGSGGCGGLGGKGGGAGGASIVIASISATLSFTDVTLNAGNGGKGGDGGNGQLGGSGGDPGPGGIAKPTYASLNDACAGGPGGKGGDGGKGGGGRGGHAIGIAYTGDAAPVITGVSFKNKGAAGDGGKGDSASAGTSDGAKGALADVQKF